MEGAFEWGGFAGTRFIVYPKLGAGFVFMRNSFGFRGSVLSVADVAIQQLNGMSGVLKVTIRKWPVKKSR